jgi:hypothetical protein
VVHPAYPRPPPITHAIPRFADSSAREPGCGCSSQRRSPARLIFKRRLAIAARRGPRHRRSRSFAQSASRAPGPRLQPSATSAAHARGFVISAKLPMPRTIRQPSRDPGTFRLHDFNFSPS